MEEKFAFSGVANTGIYRAQDGTVRGMWDGLEITVQEFVIRVAEARAAAARAHAMELQNSEQRKEIERIVTEWKHEKEQTNRLNEVLQKFYDWYQNAGSWSNVSFNPEDGCRWILKPDEHLEGERLSDAIDALLSKTEKRNNEAPLVCPHGAIHERGWGTCRLCSEAGVPQAPQRGRDTCVECGANRAHWNSR